MRDIAKNVEIGKASTRDGAALTINTSQFPRLKFKLGATYYVHIAGLHYAIPFYVNRETLRTLYSGIIPAHVIEDLEAVIRRPLVGKPATVRAVLARTMKTA